MSSVTVSGVSSGSHEQELEKLFREHYRMLYRTAYSILGTTADAEDVPQTVFLRLLRSGITPDVRVNPKGYLFRAAVNLSLNVLRSRKRHAVAGDAERLEIPGDVSRSNLLEDTDSRLSEAIAQMEPEAAQLVILRYVHGQSDGDIAKMLGTSRGTIAMRLLRARARLKKLMQSLEEEK